MAKSKKPSGLKIARDGNKFTCSWKKGESYSAQTFYYRLNEGEWIKQNVGSGTSKVITLSASDYYPNTETKLEKIEFKIKGKKSGKKYSAFVSLSYALGVPNIPEITETLDSTLSNKTKFEWKTETSDSDEKWFTNNAYQTVLVGNCNTDDGNQIDWSNAEVVTKNAEDYVEIPEDTSLFNVEGYSYTRWVRMWARGAKGDSGYRYARHVYAMTNQATNVKASASLNQQGGYTCKVSWDTTSNIANPSDQTIVQYAMTAPAAGMTCPSGASWTDANVSQDIGATDTAVFSIDDTLSDDQCLFVRVNTKHDNNTTYGAAVLADVGELAAPTNLSVTANDTTHKISVTCTNNSSVPDSYIAIRYVPASNTEAAFVVGIIPHGSSSVSAVQCPDWSDDDYNIEAYAVVGPYTTDTRSDNVIVYEINEKMRSAGYLKHGGAIPSRPANVAVAPTEISGTVRVTWDWTWADADGAELSWADHEDAWESTDGPDTFELSRIHASAWNISGLETGQKWYVRVRLFSGTETKTYGSYSDTVTIDLSSAPSIPTLVLSDSVITEDGEVTASWAYSTTDGTAQAYAEICEAELTANGIEYGDIIAHVQTAQHITINAKDAGWETGETYLLCVRVVSASGRVSDSWSDPVAVTIAEPLVCEITDTSLEEITVTHDSQNFTVLALTELPLTVTVTGAGDGGITTVAVERAEDYHVERPDETEFDGYEGETVLLRSQTGENEIAFGLADITGALDDGASYRIVAVVTDSFGQKATDSIEFEVHWEHQALAITATAEVSAGAVKITPSKPTGALATDTADIYRLSADKPTLIYKDAVLGDTYVDPYPTLGEYGGHRVVFKTANGDYITANDELAFADTGEADGDNVPAEYGLVIDFPDGTLELNYNIDVSNNWSKDFQETQYLGGSVQGDWNAAVSRTASIGGVLITLINAKDIRLMRRLAVYAGICHVRTHDGSNYVADVQVSEQYDHDEQRKIAKFSLNITRVDAEELDGMTLADWQAE